MSLTLFNVRLYRTNNICVQSTSDKYQKSNFRNFVQFFDLDTTIHKGVQTFINCVHIIEKVNSWPCPKASTRLYTDRAWWLTWSVMAWRASRRALAVSSAAARAATATRPAAGAPAPAPAAGARGPSSADTASVRAKPTSASETNLAWCCLKPGLLPDALL